MLQNIIVQFNMCNFFSDMGPPRNSTSNLPPSEFIDDDPQSVYDSVPRTEDVFNLNKHDLELFDKLGEYILYSVYHTQ